MNLPKKVKIVEVGPRDGLQNEKQSISIDTKIELIQKLTSAGVSYIEAGSFVNPNWIPQMAGSEEIFLNVQRSPKTTYAALTPNVKGYERAIAVNADEVAIFTAASEAFNQKNINCTISESLDRFEPVMRMAKEQGIKVRAYVSCVVACPYEGLINPKKVAEVSKSLLDIGCYEVSLGDTIGVGTPSTIVNMLEECLKVADVNQLAVHFHDTYGQALANIYAAMQLGISTIDSSVAGLGGCPYAKGATGNVATEDVVYLLQGLNIDHGIDLSGLIEAGEFICKQLNRENGSKVARAVLNAELP